MSPFCTGTPIFTLAESPDLVIACGEYNSGVEILNLSKEPEQIFTITKIVNHPDYQPNRVRIRYLLSRPKSKSKVLNPKIQRFGLWLTIKLLGPPPPTHPPTHP